MFFKALINHVLNIYSYIATMYRFKKISGTDYIWYDIVHNNIYGVNSNVEKLNQEQCSYIQVYIEEATGILIHRLSHIKDLGR
jgi:hypothetical protein